MRLFDYRSLNVNHLSEKEEDVVGWLDRQLPFGFGEHYSNYFYLREIQSNITKPIYLEQFKLSPYDPFL